MLLVALLLILVTILIFKVIIEPMHYWEKRGVIHPKWYHHFYYNYLVIFKKRSVAYFVQELYDYIPGVSYYGLHQLGKPNLVLKDVDLIKQITIKDFDYFTNRNFSFAAEDEPLFGKNLLNLKGQKWRDMRSYLSPSFTTNKMKMLFHIMDNCGEKFVNYFLEKEGDIIEIDMKDAFTRYTNDVIASGVFGIEVDSLKEPNNEFYLRGRQATDLTNAFTAFKVMCGFLAPKLYKFLGLQILPKDTSNFFTKLLNDTIKLREEGKIVQTDMIHIMLEAKKEYESQEKAEQSRHAKACVTTEDIMSQAFIFFFAGFESVARTMCFMAYELAINQDVQQRLRTEIEEVSNNCNGKITYDQLMGMKYMDMVVSEVLRKHPVQIATDRTCTRPYVLKTNREGEKPGNIDVGTSITIPTFAIHHDPQLFPNPEKFDPERFSDDNKSNIEPYAYQPFGIGPRHCIASRFALMETKMVFFSLLKKFEIIPTAKTEVPLVYLKTMMSLTAENGFWFGIKRL